MFCLLVCFIFWFIVSKVRKIDFKEVKGKLQTSLIVLLFLIHPNLVNSGFSYFNCDEIEGTKRLQLDLSIKCFEGPHLKWALIAGFPTILLWGFGIPLFAFYSLYKVKNNLKDLEVRQRLAFLYKGYKKEFYYWEIIVIFQKIAFIFI